METARSSSEKTVIKTDKAPAPIGPYNQAILVNNTLYVSGQIAINPATNELMISDIATETRRVMDNIGAILTAAGMDFHHIVKSSIFLSNMDNFQNVNAIYGEFFGEDAPARETVQVARLPKDVNVEISVIAVK